MDIVDVLKVGLPGLVFLLALLSYRLLTQEQAKGAPDMNMLAAIKNFMNISISLAILTAITPILSKALTDTSASPSLNKYSAEVRVSSDNLPHEQACVCSHVEYGNRWLLITDESKSKMLQVFGNNQIPCDDDDGFITLDQEDALLIGLSAGDTPFLVGLAAAEPGQKYALPVME